MLNLNELSATKKGLLTGLLMLLVSLLANLAGKQPVNGLHIYLVYGLYTAGIVWTLLSFDKKGQHDNKLKAFFNEGFRCFIVVTLLMVVYTFCFLKMNTQLQEEYARMMQEGLTKEGNKTPAEVTAQIAVMRSRLPTVITSGAVFFYLVIGVIVTFVTGAFITRNRN